MERAKHWLILIRHSPYGSSLSQAALDTTLAAAAFDRPVDVLFLGAGVLHLLPTQNGRSIRRRDLAKQWASLPLYDVKQVYADSTAATHYGVRLDESPINAEAIADEAIRLLLADSDVLLGF
ncbi:MAG: sulfurtransferase complex subunit TusC [Pseudomonadota bacterium]